jgi:hypothetical protein
VDHVAKKRKQKRIGVIDAETTPFKYGRVPIPFVWGIKFDTGEYYYFWGDDCTAQLIEFLQDEKDLTLYAHNGGKFDFFFLLKHLDPEIKVINGRIAKATLFNEQIELRDSFLILPLALSAHDKDTEFDYTKMEVENRELHKQEILDYLRRDCDSLLDWVENFRKNFGTKLTLASSAFDQLKQTGYPVENTNDHFDSKFRPFYMGGRVQCFQVGEFIAPKDKPFKYHDINSAYSYAMIHKHWQGAAYRETFRIPPGDNGSWFAHIDAVSKGALPFLSDDETWYPDDDNVREYHTTGWEILAGLKTGTLDIKKIHRCYVPTFKADFKEYVDKFFELKKMSEEHNDPTMRQFAKFMLNSCYGKFGQDGRDFEAWLIETWGARPEPYEDKEGNITEWDQHSVYEGVFSIYSKPDPSPFFYNVATAASVTGFVRAYLWEHICASENPMYCDTDSLICSEFAGDLDPVRLGAWDLEAEITEAYIAQKKMYALKTTNPNPKKRYKVASKGVRLTFDEIKNGVINRENYVHYKDAPAFSLGFGVRFISRLIDFKNIEKNACNNPEDYPTLESRRKTAKTVKFSFDSFL